MSFKYRPEHDEISESQSLDYDEIDKQLAANIEGNLDKWFDGKKRIESGAFYKIGSNGSLAVNRYDGHWHSHETDDSGKGLLSLYAWQFSVDLPTAANDLSNAAKVIEFRQSRKDKPKAKEAPQWEHSNEKPTTDIDSHFDLGKADAAYRYRDADGNPVGVVLRWNATEQRGKEIRPVSWVQMASKESPEWKWCGFAEPRPLYRGERIKQFPEMPIVIVEGEKAADALESVLKSHIAVTWCGGTGQVGKADFSHLQGRDVTIWPDNDEAGIKAAKQIKEILPDAKILTIPAAAPSKWDAADAIESGTDAAALEKLIATAAKNAIKVERGMANMPLNFAEAKSLRPEVIVEGLLYAKSKMLVGGSAKAGKSHFVMDLVASLSRGEKFLKWQPARKFNVLYVDFELHEWELRERCGKAFDWQVPDNFGRLSLRKHYEVRDPKAISRVLDSIEAAKWDVIILDCLYKFNQVEDENDNSQMQAICAWMDKIITQYEITPILIHHFGKGSQSGKSVIDRFRGASSLVGDMDAILSLTPHEEDKNIIIETEVRSFAPTEPFVVRWDYPNFIIDDSKDASKHAKPGAKKKTGDKEILDALWVGSENAKHYNRLKLNISKVTFDKRIKEIDGVFMVKMKNDNGKLENAYYKENSGRSD